MHLVLCPLVRAVPSDAEPETNRLIPDPYTGKKTTKFSCLLIDHGAYLHIDNTVYSYV
jgi:hypothetical protein